ncbi:alpha/beta hydrolase family protein [Myxococcaceae bacterium GXIMD 01537]
MMASVLSRVARSARRLVSGAHPLDRVVGLLGRERLFAEGWGDEELLAGLEARGVELVPRAAVPDVRWGRSSGAGALPHPVSDGTFDSPSTNLPSEVRTAHVRRIGQNGRSACVVLAASREEGFRLRTWLYGPLVKEGVDLFLLENPFYGVRRAQGQRGASVSTVSEHLQMNLASIEEARALVAYARELGYRRVALAGYSMGGFMAALAATAIEAPIGVAVLAGGASPAPVFTRGSLSLSVDSGALARSPYDASSAPQRLWRLFDAACATRRPAPALPTAAVIVAPARDGFVPLAEAEALHSHWPGSELRVIDAGHVTAIVRRGHDLRAAVHDAVRRAQDV